MKKTIYLLLLVLAFTRLVTAQSVGINSDGSAPNGSAMLDVSSTAKGMLIPRICAYRSLNFWLRVTYS